MNQRRLTRMIGTAGTIVAMLACGGGAGFAQPAGPNEASFPLLGQVRPRSAAEISSSSWSVGGETLDRDFAVYASYKKFLGPLGAKRIRLQAGWAKCEKKPGVYDWAWLDEIVNDALAQGVQPWLESSYGNTVYPGGGGTGLGGGLPKSPEALAAWDNWVRALVRHFKDRVKEWEVWNEPDISKTIPPVSYAEFYTRTAEIIRAEQPDARLWALALAHDTRYAEGFLTHMQQTGKTRLMDAVTVHAYPLNPDDTSLALKMRAMLAKYAPHASVRQGETGAPSTSNTFGALKGHPWTELTQAKWNLRRMLAHHGVDVPFNLFTLMELQYTTGWNTKGLLKANADRTVAYAKPAYFAAQNVLAIFDDSLARLANFACKASVTNALASFAYTNKSNGAQAVTLWFKGAAPSDSNTRMPVDLVFHASRFTHPVFVDLRLGKVHSIPAVQWTQEDGGCSFRGIPIYDSPILIAERDLIPLRKEPANTPNTP